MRLGGLSGLKVRAHHRRAVLTTGTTLLPLKQFLEEKLRTKLKHRSSRAMPFNRDERMDTIHIQTEQER